MSPCFGKKIVEQNIKCPVLLPIVGFFDVYYDSVKQQQLTIEGKEQTLELIDISPKIVMEDNNAQYFTFTFNKPPEHTETITFTIKETRTSAKLSDCILIPKRDYQIKCSFKLGKGNYTIESSEIKIDRNFPLVKVIDFIKFESVFPSKVFQSIEIQTFNIAAESDLNTIKDEIYFGSNKARIIEVKDKILICQIAMRTSGIVPVIVGATDTKLTIQVNSVESNSITEDTLSSFYFALSYYILALTLLIY